MVYGLAFRLQGGFLDEFRQRTNESNFVDHQPNYMNKLQHVPTKRKNNCSTFVH